ncbi:unnamed protein product [Caenorhabditis angaria]|uniref:Uncharacterized protein n=1 Tax=Caenorhabditis angaria TaxID=860376 RepID=A0A9P1I7F9_9PELO|nr:unnamed protein product [Caenorhabditis angaria]
MVETWKLKEIMNRAYVELAKYAEEPIFKIPMRTIKQSEALEVLYKLFSDYPSICDQLEYLKDDYLPQNSEPKNILIAHKSLIFNYMKTKNRQLEKFCANQGVFLDRKYYMNDLMKSEMFQNGLRKMQECREIEFMNILPTIPLRFEMSWKQFYELMKTRIPWAVLREEDRPKSVELFVKFFEFLDFTKKSDGEVLLKRKVIPARFLQNEIKFLFCDKKLLNSSFIFGKEQFYEEAFEVFRERFEEIRDESENQKEVEVVLKLLKSFQNWN